MTKPSISLFGYGRFGKLFADILQDFYSIEVFDPNHTSDSISSVAFVSEEKALTNDTIIYAVPIAHFKDLFNKHLHLLKTPKTLIDVLSVKCLPKEVFQSAKEKGHTALLTHPMFGPDSVKRDGLTGQTIAIDSSLSDPDLSLIHI